MNTPAFFLMAFLCASAATAQHKEPPRISLDTVTVRAPKKIRMVHIACPWDTSAWTTNLPPAPIMADTTRKKKPRL